MLKLIALSQGRPLGGATGAVAPYFILKSFSMGFQFGTRVINKS